MRGRTRGKDRARRQFNNKLNNPLVRHIESYAPDIGILKHHAAHAISSANLFSNSSINFGKSSHAFFLARGLSLF